MEKAGRNNILYYLLLILTAALPITASKFFFNVNDLPKSSILILLGGVIILTALSLSIIRIFKEGSLEIHYAGLLDTAVFIFLISLIISTIFSLRPMISLSGQY